MSQPASSARLKDATQEAQQKADGLIVAFADPLRAGVVIARQPILHHHRRVGYELLYRGHEEGFLAGDVVQTSRTVVASMFELGLDSVVGSSDAWVNVSTAFLEAGHHLAMPPERVVLEILEGEAPTADLIELIRQAQQLGFRVALDDYARGSRQTNLTKVVDIVKVDMRFDGAVEVIRQLSNDGIAVVAEKVEAPAQYAATQIAGADYFQGFFFAKPKLVSREGVPSVSHLAGLHLLPELLQNSCHFDRVLDVVSRDPAMAARIVIACNSSHSGLRRQIDSLREAVVYLGADRVRRMAILSMLDGCRGDAPLEVLRVAAMRASLCRSRLEAKGDQAADIGYTCGLLSVLDVLADQPMSQRMLEGLGLPYELCRIMGSFHGAVGRVLRDTIDDVERSDRVLSGSVSAEDYLEAIRSADQLVGMLAGAG